MNLLPRLPRLIEVRERLGLCFAIHDDGTVAVHFELSHIDAELIRLEEIECSLPQAFKELSTEITVRLRSFCEPGLPDGFPHARVDALKEIGGVTNRLILTFEKQRPSSLRILSHLLSFGKGSEDVVEPLISALHNDVSLKYFERLGMKPRPLRESEIRALYPPPRQPIGLTSYGLDFGSHVAALVKLQRLGASPLSYLDLAVIREALPVPFEIHFSARKLSALQAQFFLNRRSKQESTGSGAVAAQKYQESQATLEEIELHGANLFSFELTIMLRRDSEADARKSVQQALPELKRLGEFKLETTGALSAYLATVPGSTGRHFTILERDEALGCLTPLLVRADQAVVSSSPGAMAYHRLDSSVSFFDLFHRRYESFSAVIIGQPGLGKSVWANTLLRSTLHDPKARVILVDVRGSHVKTTERLGGHVRHVSLDQPSGINPLAYLSPTSSRDEIEIVASFIKQLILNDGEHDLPVKDAFAVEERVKAYAHSGPRSPSIDDFIKICGKDFPRPEHLARWGSKALHGNVFRKSDEAVAQDERLTYYNFEQIMTASNRGLATGVLAAVMAEFSFSLLKKSADEKLVFIADETPFFVQHCFHSFRLLMKNVRKLNGSLVLIAQDHSDLVVGGDPSLLNNAPTRILFSADGDRALYRERLRLSVEELETIENLKGEKGEYSKFLLADSLGSRVGLLRLSREEYLFSSTSASDQTRLDRLRRAVPGLSETEALEILTLIGQRHSPLASEASL